MKSAPGLENSPPNMTAPATLRAPRAGRGKTGDAPEFHDFSASRSVYARMMPILLDRRGDF
jgi:hypothetical protein